MAGIVHYGAPRVINQVYMQQIYSYYNDIEGMLLICKDVSYAMTFRGGVSLRWGGVSKPSRLELGEERNLEDLLTRALDYRNMFGFCPLKFWTDPSTDQRRVSVPEFGTGTFVVELNHTSMNTHVRFIPRQKHGGGSLFGMGSAYGQQKQDTEGEEDDTQVDIAYEVYVWKGHEPSYDALSYGNVSLKSNIHTLYQRFVKYDSFEEDALTASWNNARPPVWLQSKINSTRFNPAEMDDGMLYAPTPAGPINSEDMSTSERVHVRQDALRQGADQETRLALSAGDPSRTRVDPKTGIAHSQRRERIWDNMIHLDQDSQLAPSGPKAEARSDLIQLREQYEQQVCLSMGIPPQVAMGNRGGERLQATADQEGQILKISISKNRRDAASFYEFIWEKMYREDENRLLVKAFGLLDQRKAAMAPDDADGHLLTDQMHDRLTRLAGSKRVELVFLDSSIGNTKLDDIMKIAAFPGVLDPLELANLMRESVGLEPLRSISATAVATVANASPAAAPGQEPRLK